MVGQAATDVLLRLWTVRAADARARRGRSRDFAYEFAFDRAAHGQDVAYFWDTVDATSREDLPGASEVATEMHTAAVQFMTTGDPGWPHPEGPRADSRRSEEWWRAVAARRTG